MPSKATKKRAAEDDVIEIDDERQYDKRTKAQLLAAIARLTEQVDQMSDELAEKDASLAEHDAQLAAKDAKIAKAHDALHKFNHCVNLHEQYRKQLEGNIADRDSSIAEERKSIRGRLMSGIETVQAVHDGTRSLDALAPVCDDLKTLAGEYF